MATIRKAPPLNQATPQKEKPRSILQVAHEIVYGDREQTYGNPSKNLNLIAKYWSAHLSATTGENIELTALDVAGMMILLKQARLANNPTHMDSLTDIAGYVALEERIICTK